jgi:hypothetical protein
VSGAGAAAVVLQSAGLANHGVSGTASAEIPAQASGSGDHVLLLASGAGAVGVPITAAGDASHGVAGAASAGVAFTVQATAQHGVAGGGIGAINCTLAGLAAHGVAGAAHGSGIFSVRGNAIHERYEVRGEVREGGVLVNRRVRVYLRSTGALMGEADTVVGKFSLHTGFTQSEHYITPIDLGEFAADWLPPTANRIVPVLAYDLA